MVTNVYPSSCLNKQSLQSPKSLGNLPESQATQSGKADAFPRQFVIRSLHQSDWARVTAQTVRLMRKTFIKLLFPLKDYITFNSMRRRESHRLQQFMNFDMGERTTLSVEEMLKAQKEFEELTEDKVKTIQMKEFLNNKGPADHNYKVLTLRDLGRLPSNVGLAMNSLNSVDKLSQVQKKLKVIQHPQKTLQGLFEQKYSTIKNHPEFKEFTMSGHYQTIQKALNSTTDNTPVLQYMKEVVNRRNPYMHLYSFIDQIQKRLVDQQEFVIKKCSQAKQSDKQDEELMDLIDICDRCF